MTAAEADKVLRTNAAELPAMFLGHPAIGTIDTSTWILGDSWDNRVFLSVKRDKCHHKQYGHCGKIKMVFMWLVKSSNKESFCSQKKIH